MIITPSPLKTVTAVDARTGFSKNRKESPWTAHAWRPTPEMFRALWLTACWQRWHVPEKRAASAQAGAR
jgi:hypothetical protein